MPTIKDKGSKKPSNEDALLLKIRQNVESIRNSEDLELVKSISCSFFKSGQCPDCRNCPQPDLKVFECRDDYVKKIESRPMETWAIEFDKLEVREKVKITTIIDMGLACDRCHISDKCPLYKAGATCAIDWTEEETTDDPKKMMDKLIKVQLSRVIRSSKIEELEGGVTDQNTSAELDRLQGMINTRNEMNTEKFKLSVEASRQQNNDQPQESLLSKLFSSIGNKPAQQELPPTMDTVPLEVNSIPITQKHKKDADSNRDH